MTQSGMRLVGASLERRWDIAELQQAMIQEQLTGKARLVNPEVINA